MYSDKDRDLWPPLLISIDHVMLSSTNWDDLSYAERYIGCWYGTLWDKWAVSATFTFYLRPGARRRRRSHAIFKNFVILISWLALNASKSSQKLPTKPKKIDKKSEIRDQLKFHKYRIDRGSEALSSYTSWISADTSAKRYEIISEHVT